MKRPLVLLAAGVLALSALQPALAGNHDNKGHGHGKGKDKDRGGAEAGDVVLDLAITAAEIAIIAAYIDEFGLAPFGGAPQGLPPGIAKNLARGKPLPPGIAKRYLPGNLLSRLPARPGYDWLVVDNDILLVVAGTALIVDILADAL